MVKQKATRSWTLILLILLSLYLAASILAGMVSLFGEGKLVVDGNVAVIPIKGIITSEGGNALFGGSAASANDIIDLIQKAESEEKIKAVIFEINSPGGSAVASEEISDAIKSMNKTSVAWIREVGASGAYWAASATDHIVASRMTTTGSIGVLSSYLEFSGLIERFNISYERLVAGKYKDMRTPYRELSEDEKEMVQKQLDMIHLFFIEGVAENRGLDSDDVEELAEGQVYMGYEAIKLDLIDEIGSKAAAVAYIENNLNITADLVDFHKEVSFFESMSGLISSHGYSTGLGIQDALTVKT